MAWRMSMHSTKINSEIEYLDGNKKRSISDEHLKDIRSRITTHEGELLSGSKGRAYMDKYSAKYLNKDMSGRYLDNTVHE